MKPTYVLGLMVMVTRASKFTVVTLSNFFAASKGNTKIDIWEINHLHPALSFILSMFSCHPIAVGVST